MKSIRYNVLFLVAARRQIHDVRVNREMLREIYWIEEEEGEQGKYKLRLYEISRRHSMCVCMIESSLDLFDFTISMQFEMKKKKITEHHVFKHIVLT